MRTPERAKGTVPTSGDDAALMAAYAAGAGATWGPLFDCLAPRLLGFYRRCLQDATLAERYVEACFVELHRSRGRYRTGTPVRRFVFSVAVQVRVDDFRCLDRPDRGAGTGAADPYLSGENGHDREVREAIDGLPRIDRSLIHLHRLERMGFGEIAQVLGWTEAAVRHQVRYAYHRLRGRLWTASDDGERP